MRRRINLSVPDEDLLERLSEQKRPCGMFATAPTYHILRETYFDTVDQVLQERRMTLRLRTEARGRQVAVLRIMDGVNLQGVLEETVLEVPVVDGGMYATLAGTSEIASRVRDVTDPAALRPQVAIDIDRETRELKSRRFGRPVHQIAFDQIIAHTGVATRAFQEITVHELVPGSSSLESIADRLRSLHGLESDGLDTFERARLALAGPALPTRMEVPHDVRVAVLLLWAGKVGLVSEPEGLMVPTAMGSGEDLALEQVREVLAGVPTGLEVELVGYSPTRRGGSDLEVWLHEIAPSQAVTSDLIWLPLTELLERVGAPRLRDPRLSALLLLVVRSEIGSRLLRESTQHRGPPTFVPPGERDRDLGPGQAPEDFLDLELSTLEFNQRVLELAEDSSIPLLERFRFVSILSSNLDEFFVVRVGRLKADAARGPRGDGDLSPAELLDLIAIRIRALMVRQYGCLSQTLLPILAERGVRIRRWDELTIEERADLERQFAEDIYPRLTPLAMSSSPGRSFPTLVSLGLSLAVVMRRSGEDRADFGYVPIPDRLDRFVPVPGSSDLILIEDVIAANASRLYPSAEVQDVHAFRVSRMGDVDIDDDASGSLLAAIADEVEARPYKPVVRIEVQSTMSRDVRAHLLRELRAEAGSDSATLGRADVYEVDGPLDLRGFAELADLDVKGGLWPAFTPARPLAESGPIFDVLAAGDLLVHHPYQDFGDTVLRFLDEAADDPDVVAIKLTLYRTGRDSPVMEALLRALGNGKDVSVFVELKARFDEESNIEWTHRLTRAGANVVYGVVGYKTHAKTALVVRHESGGIRRYVHVGTGNYNAATARFYTDIGLFSADPDLGADVNDFFNELTGSQAPPARAFRRILVAPSSLVQRIEAMIYREIEHARAGRPARIQAKLNGLADRQVIRALYEASQAGVEVDLIVRSICTLRPGVSGLSERIRVRSLLGRLLEHSRIYFFENAGQSEYYIGSADWRARNLRRRVEVVAPVDDPAARATLRSILDRQLADPTAWVLRPDGVFERLSGPGLSSQEAFLADFADTAGIT